MDETAVTERAGSVLSRALPWVPVAVMTVLVVVTPWVILAVLVLPARPSGPSLPVIVAGALLALPFALVAVTARSAITTRRKSRARGGRPHVGRQVGAG